jgi:maltooligosyltrehalose trehalohydrolase
MSILQRVGAWMQPDGNCTFKVWAPELDNVSLQLTAPEPQTILMQKNEFGYWSATLPNISPETRYLFRLNNNLERPDPASMYQPTTVHDPSGIVDHNRFNWTDQNWTGVPLEKMIIYELHTGTFTEQHNFEGIIQKLDYLQDLGINAIELMPIAQFPGDRNWGYDGVYPYAAQNSYGGPEGLKKLVDACHAKGIAVVLDVVYNHLGPEGNYLNDFGPYFTDKYQTPWGRSLNFDDAYCDGVRNFFIQNALMWLREYHIDALRLDAVHAIMDMSANHFLRELAGEVNKLNLETGKQHFLIAESDLNDVRMINPLAKGGHGMDAQWSDEFHHALHALTTGETSGYYSDFGNLDDLEKAFRDTFVFNGNYSPHRHKTYGNNASENPGRQFVVFAQNHDQVGNRMLGDRISGTVSFPLQKLIAATYLLSPYVPMLFMGEEYGEKNPFQYFISHSEKELVEAVRNGRKEEFKSFYWAGEVPDPQSKETFRNSTLSWTYQQGQNNKLWNYYRDLIRLRKTHEVFSQPNKQDMKISSDPTKNLLTVERWHNQTRVKLLLNFGKESLEAPEDKNETWKILLDSSEDKSLNEPAIPLKDKVVVQPESVLILESRLFL